MQRKDWNRPGTDTYQRHRGLTEAMRVQCSTRGSKAVAMPWRALVEDVLYLRCDACETYFSSALSGPGDTARRWVMASFATALGMSLFAFIGIIGYWILALAVVFVTNATWRIHLHTRSVQPVRKAS